MSALKNCNISGQFCNEWCADQQTFVKKVMKTILSGLALLSTAFMLAQETKTGSTTTQGSSSAVPATQGETVAPTPAIAKDSDRTPTTSVKTAETPETMKPNGTGTAPLPATTTPEPAPKSKRKK